MASVTISARQMTFVSSSARQSRVNKHATLNVRVGHSKDFGRLNAAGNVAYGSWDWDSEDDEGSSHADRMMAAANKALNAMGVKAPNMDGNWFSDWSDEWHDPACINGDYGSWDFDDGMPPAVPVPAKVEMKAEGKQRPIRAPASDF